MPNIATVRRGPLVLVASAVAWIMDSPTFFITIAVNTCTANTPLP